ncbi:recombinase family protein [Mesorhizobium sp. M0621]|uniref:recombinase family protein n=1 Tax=Mesorhizobium sp. M0621 TaxID=2956974 RepID=UPI00333C35A9
MKTLPFSHSHSYTGNIETPVAYSYIRWSSAIQGEGDSFRRQKHLAEKWCQRNGVLLADDKIMVDAGVSAFRGKNLKEGAISAFVTSAKDGFVAKGSYLLVESLDRLSRMRTAEVLTIFLDLLRAGIVLVTLGDDDDDERSFRWEDLDEENLKEAISDMKSNHRFVQKLSRRVRDSWAGRTQKARSSGKHIPGNPPAWLYEASGELQMDEAKVAIVQRIFDMCISGLGITAIAQILNKEGVPLLAKHKRKTIKNRSDFWTVTSVAYVLRSKAVFGEYHPKDGDPWIAFPPIVSKEDYYRAEASRAKRHMVAKGRTGKHYTNLFKGIAKCHYCGEAMNIKDGRNQKQPHKALQFRCRGVGVKTCSHKPWNYDVFESAFLSVVREIDTRAVIGDGSESKLAEITKQLQALQGERSNLMKVEETYLSAIEKTPDIEPIYQGRVRSNRQKLDAINAQAKVLEVERNKVHAERSASNELLPVELPKDAKIRAKVAEHIRTIVECVTLKRDGTSKFDSSFSVHFAGGGIRTVHVDYTNAKKPYAVTGGFKGKDIIPDDLVTATGLGDCILAETMREVDWMVENGGKAGLDGAKRVIERMEEVQATIERQARELGFR